MEEADKKLKSVLADEELKNCPILVMVNKQDLDIALNQNEVIDKLGMGMLKGRTWLVQGSDSWKRS